MKTNKYYDVLNIKSQNEEANIVQSYFGNDCLGLFFDGEIAKLYFNNDHKKKIEKKLQNISKNLSLKWNWSLEENKNWHLMWQPNFKPILINKKLIVAPHWEETNHKYVIKIKPGMAFGTGHHETTFLILKQMIKYIKPDYSVLDLGTGSGILSIAAFVLGAKKIDAVENDIDCLHNFKENLEINNISNKINYHNSNVLVWNKFNYDLILVNINQNIIEKLIPKLINLKSIIILTGLLKTNYNSIKNLCREHQLKIKNKSIRGDWVCITI